ncbi:alpha/beta fold hydrolase [Verticiella sediminum]|uniref:Alpha/beta fold hydrolase n=1 Tax=Verticiella sediminum TaxID=1247510 RepID=A0A556AQ52_9BURK|nr:acyl-CoA-binding protein [Verticiella sediminum]TSH95038.1 alpha/beta fold hydrolase [Verticiella sediminum]
MASAIGALLIHGLGGTQYDLGSMHKVLQRGGIETHALTLPGHGGQPEDLLRVKAEHWVEAVTAKYREIVGRYETLHVMGMCMGSLLALELCRRERHAKGRLVTLAPPIYIDGWSTPWYAPLRHLLYYVPGVPARMKVEEEDPYGIKNELVRAIVKAKFERGEAFHYRWVPLACVREVDRLRNWVMSGAKQIGCPTLVVHAREDELTSLRSADFLHRALPDARMTVLENSYHMICVDNDREQVAANVLSFFGIDPATTRRPASAEPVTPMSEAEQRELFATYAQAMREQQYEALFPLFASDVSWEQQGDNPVAGVYTERSQLIDLFSRLMSHSGGTFAVAGFGEPRFDLEAHTVEVDIAYTVGKEGARRSSQGVQRLGLRNRRIATVLYTPADPGVENALWHAPSPSGASMQDSPAINARARALAGAELQQAFEQASQDVKQLGQRPSNQVLLQLYGLYKQGSEGDAGGARPGMTDFVGRAKYDAWAALAGTERETAQRQYVSLVDALRG